MVLTKKWPGARPKLPNHGRTQDALRADFDAAHQAAARALKERDFDGVADAIARERAVIDEMRARIKKQIPAHSHRRI